MKKMRLFPYVRMPLLSKELIELAARKRTYIVRVVFALLMFLFFFFFRGFRYFSGTRDPFSVIGSGRHIFELLMVLQFAGIYIFLPAMMSSVLTSEKERKSLGLVFLTDMKPREILLQKFASRLIPVFSFLIIGFPLMALTYSLGGVSTDYLFSAVYILFVTCFQVGAFSLLFSSYCRTSLGSFMCSYLLGGFFVFFLPVLYILSWVLGMRFRPDEDVMLMFFTPYVFFDNKGKGFGSVLFHSMPAFISGITAVVLARFFLLRRAFARSRRILIALLIKLDRFINYWNDKVGGIEIIKTRPPVLGHEPIAWREVSTRSLGNLRYIIRMFVAVELPVMLMTAGMLIFESSHGYYRSDSPAFTSLVAILWGIAILLVTSVSANKIALERDAGTLDILLATPLKGKDIILQKTAGIKRFFWVLGVPLATLYIGEAWFEAGISHRHRGPLTLGYLISSLLSIVVYFPFIKWLSMYISLKTRTRYRAIIGSLAALTGLIFIPLICTVFLEEANLIDIDAVFHFMPFISPVIIPALTEMEFDEITIFNVLFNYSVYWGLTVFLKRACLNRADRYLGRG